HGSVGKVQSVSAEMIGDHLASKSLGITSKLTKLVITSCYAGMRNNGKAGTSLVEILAEKLRKRGVGGLEIVGYNGPSIKTGALGMFAKVVDDTKLGEAGKLQDALIKQDPNKLSGLSTSSKSSGIAGKAADASSKS